MKRKSPRAHQESYSSSPRSSGTSESFSTKRTLKTHLDEKYRNSVHYVNLMQAKEKLETEMLFLKDVNIRV